MMQQEEAYILERIINDDEASLVQHKIEPILALLSVCVFLFRAAPCCRQKKLPWGANSSGVTRQIFLFVSYTVFDMEVYKLIF